MNKDFICEFCGKTFISTINEERQIIALHLEINTIQGCSIVRIIGGRASLIQ